jgi:transcriptional regulator with XRE-family HTH domain
MPTALHSRRYERFRNLLARERRDAGLTQEALAKKLSKPQSFVSKYENGERRLDVVEFLDIAAAIGFDPAKFIREMQG